MKGDVEANTMAFCYINTRPTVNLDTTNRQSGRVPLLNRHASCDAKTRSSFWRSSFELPMTALGYPSSSVFSNWRRKAREHGALTLSVDVLMRISAVLGIHAALSQLFQTDREAKD
jgi:hypothetical protein